MSTTDHMIMGRKVEVKRAVPKENEEINVIQQSEGRLDNAKYMLRSGSFDLIPPMSEPIKSKSTVLKGIGTTPLSPETGLFVFLL